MLSDKILMWYAFFQGYSKFNLIFLNVKKYKAMVASLWVIANQLLPSSGNTGSSQLLGSENVCYGLNWIRLGQS